MKKIILLGLIIILSSIVYANNISINYGYDYINSVYLPISLTPDGWQNVNINLFNLSAGNLSLSGCISMIDGTFCTIASINQSGSVGGGNTTQEMITAVNTTGFIINWSTIIIDTDTNTWNTSQEMITAVNYSGLLINWNFSGFIKDWSYIDTDTDTYNTTQEMITAVNTTGFLINWSNVISPVASGGNTTQEMITAVNTTGLLINWSNYFIDTYNTTQEMITAVNTTGFLINWSNVISPVASGGNTTQEMITAVNSTGLLINWNSSGFIKDWSYIDTNESVRVGILEIGLLNNATKIDLTWNALLNNVTKINNNYLSIQNNATKLDNLQTSFYNNVTKVDLTYTSLLANVTKLDNLQASFLSNVTKIDNNALRIDTINFTKLNIIDQRYNETQWVIDQNYLTEVPQSFNQTTLILGINISLDTKINSVNSSLTTLNARELADNTTQARLIDGLIASNISNNLKITAVNNSLLNYVPYTGATSNVNLGDYNITSNNFLIRPTKNTSTSTSVGGAINLINTNNIGAGLIIYSNMDSNANGRLMNIRADNSGFDQAALHIDYDGTANAFEVVHNGVDSTAQAFNVVSNNYLDSAFTVTSNATTKGVAKIVHRYFGDDDSSSSAISIDLQGIGTAAQGIFIDSTTGETKGDLLHLKNNGTLMLELNYEGNLTTNGTICDGLSNCLNTVDTYNTTQEMITAVNTTGFLINWSNVISPVASGGNTTQEMITAVNTTGLLINWNATGYIINWSNVISPVASGGNTTQEMITAVNTTGLLINWSNYFIDTYNTTQEMITAVNTTGFLINWNASGLIKNWSIADTYNTSKQMYDAVNNTVIHLKDNTTIGTLTEYLKISTVDFLPEVPGNFILPVFGFTNNNLIGFNTNVGLFDNYIVIARINQSSVDPPTLIFGEDSLAKPIGSISYLSSNETFSFNLNQNTNLGIRISNISLGGMSYPIISSIEEDNDVGPTLFKEGIAIIGDGANTGYITFYNSTGSGGLLAIDVDGNMAILGSITASGSITISDGGLIQKNINQSLRGDVLTVENSREPTVIGQETNLLFKGKTDGGLSGRTQNWGRIGFNQTDITEYLGQAEFFIEVNNTKRVQIDWTGNITLGDHSESMTLGEHDFAYDFAPGEFNVPLISFRNSNLLADAFNRYGAIEQGLIIARLNSSYPYPQLTFTGDSLSGANGNIIYNLDNVQFDFTVGNIGNDYDSLSIKDIDWSGVPHAGIISYDASTGTENELIVQNGLIVNGSINSTTNISATIIKTGTWCQYENATGSLVFERNC